MKHTEGKWRTEAVSDAVRVVVGTGRSKIILARLAPKQLPEAETAANAHMMAAAPELYAALDNAMRLLREVWRDNPDHPIWKNGPAALAKAEGRL